MLVHPNPTANTVTIDFGQQFVGKLVVYTLNGKRVLSQKIEDETSAEIDMSTLPSALYLLKIENEFGESTMVKILKE